jgi:SAM-dependent methyltransferase
MEPPSDTQSRGYAQRLARLSGARWKRWLDVQAPYRWNLRRLHLGRTLELGCGIGRNLAYLPPGSVGIDPNAHSIAVAQERGCTAFVPEEFRRSEHAVRSFDSLLCAHVLEHLLRPEAAQLLASNVGFLRPGGAVVLIAPQEAGYRSDPTHVTFFDFEALSDVLREAGCRVERAYSFPFPRAVGHFFPHNEFVVVGSEGDGSASRRESTSRGTLPRS